MPYRGEVHLIEHDCLVVKNVIPIASRITTEDIQWFPYNFIISCSSDEIPLIYQAFNEWRQTEGFRNKLDIVIEKVSSCASSLNKLKRSISDMKKTTTQNSVIDNA